MAQTAMTSRTNALAAGHVAGIARADDRQLDQVQQLGRAPADFRIGRPGGARTGAQAMGDVLEHGHVAEQGIALKHETGATFLHGQMWRIAAVKQDPAGMGMLKSAQDAQRRGLARPRRPQKPQQRARGDGQRHRMQGRRHPFDRIQRHGQGGDVQHLADRIRSSGLGWTGQGGAQLFGQSLGAYGEQRGEQQHAQKAHDHSNQALPHPRAFGRNGPERPAGGCRKGNVGHGQSSVGCRPEAH
jgi:hypothetical protein